MLVAATLVALLIIGVGFAFAGSPDTLAPGTKIAGVDVGGLTAARAQQKLEQRASSLANVPVTFVSGGQRWRVQPSVLGVSIDWAAAVEEARHDGDGVGFLRGYKRLALRLFPTSIDPPPHPYVSALNFEVSKLAKAIDRPERDAKLVRRGGQIVTVPGQAGIALQTGPAATLIARALASFSRLPVTLPVQAVRPKVTVPDLATAQTLARRALSAPVTLVLGDQHLQLKPAQLASMLLLAQGGQTKLGIGGSAADAYFVHLDQLLSHPARNATWAVTAKGGIRVVPAEPGLAVDVAQTVAAVLAAAERPSARIAKVTVSESQPSRTTADAVAMGITGTVSSYETIYGGIPNRIHNVQLVAKLVNGKLIAPGATFSFNQATGARTAAQGFLEAPVIINGELQTGLGGGVCQVSTTVFNAAYEAGLPITARTNHALYISHYPLGRDATVDYPDVDLKFVNNTGHWLLLRTVVGPDSLVVTLYGTPQHRRIVTEATPLKLVHAPPVVKTIDRALAPGQVVVTDYGEAAYSTSVRRLVYAPDGTLLSDATWYSNYRALPKQISVGPPKKPKNAPKSPAATRLATLH
ncbi:MAG TPA: VanW family protein [Gaiellaceae bacterium]|nr:VanW family protein [Gaiellaceae bacterium]